MHGVVEVGSVAFRALLITLFALGLVARAAPLFEGGDASIPQGRMLEQWPTEDGYFMLTMARNLALGRGLSVAGGEMPTNGTQPLTTFLWALGFLLVDGDRALGVLFAQLMLIAASAATAWLTYRLGCRVLAGRQSGPRIAALAAATWFASPVALRHTMNCLETGVHAMMCTAVCLAFVGPSHRAQRLAEGVPLWSWRRTVAFGALMGVAFWVRNDAALLIGAACVAYLMLPAKTMRATAPAQAMPAGAPPTETTGKPSSGGALCAGHADSTTSANPSATKRPRWLGLGPRLLRVLVFGSVSVIVASPWLLFNVVYFGHLMPVSGRAEVLTGTLGGNLTGLPIVLAEYLMVALPIPQALSDRVWMIGLATLVVASVSGILVARRAALLPPERRLAVLVGLWLAAMLAFYGLYFGAPWFLPRYFCALSPVLALVFASGAVFMAQQVVDRGTMSLLVPMAATAMVAVMAALSVRQRYHRAEHMHFEVVHWVRAHLDESTWVGAIQTGTLGYFHDRTINLDGKVNIDAYEALLQGRETAYVVNETPIEYLADWTGMIDWLDRPLIAEHFELLREDHDANIGVLRRVGPPPRTGIAEPSHTRESHGGNSW